MERTTRKQLENMVRNLNKALNRPETMFSKDSTASKQNVGHLFLDHNTAYGGYQLAEVAEGGGERHPLGACRHTAGQMWHLLKAAQEIICFGELKKF